MRLLTSNASNKFSMGFRNTFEVCNNVSWLRAFQWYQNRGIWSTKKKSGTHIWKNADLTWLLNRTSLYFGIRFPAINHNLYSNNIHKSLKTVKVDTYNTFVTQTSKIPQTLLNSPSNSLQIDIFCQFSKNHLNTFK